MNKTLLRELAWLAVAVVLTLVLVILQFGWRFQSRTIDIHLYDTYFVVSAEILLLPIFSIVCFLLFFFKEMNHHFSRTIASIITIAAGLLLIAMLTMTTKFFPVISGFTMYPPLSALTEDTRLNYGWDEGWNTVSNIIISIQAIVAILIIYVAYRLGISRFKKNLPVHHHNG